jgi:predicted kinase
LARVYARLFEKAERALGAERTVVVDAVFAKSEERETIARIAERAGCRFAGLWLEAPADVLLARVGARRGDASDADARVVEAQLAYDIGGIAWSRVAATEGVDETLARALAALEAAGIME